MREAFLSFASRMMSNTFSNMLWFQVLISEHLDWITISKETGKVLAFSNKIDSFKESSQIK